jgi:hypothetical protein
MYDLIKLEMFSHYEFFSLLDYQKSKKGMNNISCYPNSVL